MATKLSTGEKHLGTITFGNVTSTTPASMMIAKDYAYISNVTTNSATVHYTRKYYYVNPNNYSWTQASYTWGNYGGVYGAHLINGGWDEYNMGSQSVASTTYPANSTTYIFEKSRTFNVSLSNGYWSGTVQLWDVYGYCGLSKGNTLGSYDVYIQEIYAPSTPSVSVANRAYNENAVTYGTSSFGVPSSGTVKLYGGTSSSPTTQIASKTTTGSSTYTHSSLTGNKRYYYRAKASNGSLDSAYSADASVYTPCPPLSALSLSSQSYATYNTVDAVISYTRQSDGGAEARTGKYRYSTDNGATWTTWTSFGTVSNTTGTFTVTLPTSTTVLLQARLDTPNGGASEAKQVSITTKTTHTAPNFSNFTYEDISSGALALTNNNQIFIQGQSQPKVTISTANKATANDDATITGYTASFNAESIQIAYSSSASVNGTFSANRPTASGTLALSVAANDSLSLATSVSKNVTVIPWAAPVLTATATRQNNFENNTTIQISGTYSPVKVNNVAKNTLAIAYRFKKASASSWGNWVSVSPTINDDAFTVPDFVLSFDNEYQWNIEVRAVDAFETTTVALSLAIGKPIFFISKNRKVSVNRKPTNHNADLDVEGKVYAEDSPLS